MNHHYVPQLYLKGFTADTGRLQVFDKKHKNFKKDKQTPKTILFQKNRNTIKTHNVNTDHIEKLYSYIEAPFGVFFNHIRKGISQEELMSKHGIYLLKLFVAIQFWRMPLFDDIADNYILQLDLKRFGKRITFNGLPLGENDAIRQAIKDDKGFRHYFRCFYLPLLTFNLKIDDNEVHRWKLHSVSKEYGNWDNFLTGDNPLIVENVESLSLFDTKLILPLSKNQLVTYSPNDRRNGDLPPLFSSKLAMVMYSQSQEYLVGANREYMNEIIELNDAMYGYKNLSRLREELFEYI